MDFINRLIYALTESHPIHAMVVHFPIALTGIYDGQRNYGAAVPNGSVKMILSILLFVITTSLTVLRWKNPNLLKTAKVLYSSAYFISFSLALTLGFLGGVILYGF